MKVSKDMVHKDLRSVYGKANFIARILRSKLFTRCLNILTDILLKGKDIEGLVCDEIFIPSSDGKHQIRVRTYRPNNHSGPLPLLLYIHGGGYITGSPELSAHIIKRFIKTRPSIVIAPAYRTAYNEPFPAGFNDCYETLLWARDNANSLGAQPDKFMIAGHSAGGGLTAAVTLKARDTGDVDLAFQMPIYPMIDDQQPEDPARHFEAPVWDTKANRNGWNAYLADLHKTGAQIPAYAAPARNFDYSGFPPTITLVGTLEPFYQETLSYVSGLRAANVAVAFKEYADCFHGFDTTFNEPPISQEALDFTYQSFANYYDKYVI